MKKLYCEGHYDFMYLNRLVRYYGIENIKIIPCNDKAKAINSFLKDNSQILMFDYDNGINKRYKGMIQKLHAKDITDHYNNIFLQTE
jgi:hypothetical protein